VTLKPCRASNILGWFVGLGGAILGWFVGLGGAEYYVVESEQFY